MNKRKLKKIKYEIINKIKALFKDLPKFNIRKVSLLVVVLVLVIPLGYLSVSIFKGFKELNNTKSEMIVIGSDIQLGYHRVFNLTESMDLIDYAEFKKDCEEFDFDCMYEGNALKKELFSEIKERSFSDRDIEILNMISSIQVGLTEKESKFNLLVSEYNKCKKVFPFSLISWIFEDLVFLE